MLLCKHVDLECNLEELVTLNDVEIKIAEKCVAPFFSSTRSTTKDSGCEQVTSKLKRHKKTRAHYLCCGHDLLIHEDTTRENVFTSDPKMIYLSEGQFCCI